MIASMLSIDARLFLPISESQVSSVIDGQLDLEKPLSTLDSPQFASLILLQSLPALPIEQASRAEFLLSRALDALTAQAAEIGLPELRQAMSSALDRAKITAGYRLLDDYGIALLEPELVDWRSYLNEHQAWDQGFCDRHRQRLRERLQPVALSSGEDRLLTSQQSGVYRAVVAQSDDHLHVQGYAGTGKSLLIHVLLDLLRREERRVLVLAERSRQLRALMAGMEGLGQVDGLTFGQLAATITPIDLISKAQRGQYYENTSRNPMSDEEMSRHLGVHAAGDFSAIQIVRLARKTVARFCMSGDAEIGEQHLPEEVGEPLVRQLVLHHSCELWSATVAPGDGEFRPPMRAVHRIKLAALQRWKIPAEYSHVLLDESHDLSKPILQILDVSPQATISFGDEYQSLRRRAHSRASTVKRCLITHSVRSAKAIEAIANPIIQAHPGETKDAFLGHRKYRAEVTYYSAPEIPARPAAILVKDLWELFDWAQRLASRGLSIQPLSDFAGLGQLVADCIELYSHGTRPRHGSLFRYHSWDDVRKAFWQHRSFQRLDQLLQAGTQREHWDAITRHVVPRATNGYALGLIEDVRNLEFPDVMLAPRAVADLWNGDSRMRTEATSSVYVAVTRAQHRLFVPSSLREWVEARGSGTRVVRYS
jgi:hypothetical protein